MVIIWQSTFTVAECVGYLKRSITYGEDRYGFVTRTLCIYFHKQDHDSSICTINSPPNHTSRCFDGPTCSPPDRFHLFLLLDPILGTQPLLRRFSYYETKCGACGQKSAEEADEGVTPSSRMLQTNTQVCHHLRPALATDSTYSGG